ncbi:MAG: PQQ-like beta-propeller repeat protein [Planctomycetes bacterium]|nr:PQQ-like beta-propeller repeat protein [Planctomycetota bacterium]MCB9890515.1 PQQ-like beta-propeller repeat protein [Planctomycetota bacterium]MCB9917756.1 PQQ-like beta-propeller repeat protein [Planctomycetota bacterium]
MSSAATLVAQEATQAVPTWNQWRGPLRTGHAVGRTWPKDLSGLTKLWRVPLGRSYSGPVMDAVRVFTTESRDDKTERVLAFDRATGKEIWSTGWDGAMRVPFFAARNGSWIRSTPALDDSSIYVAGMADSLTRIDKISGDVVWRVDLKKDWKHPMQAFGFVCSPLIDDASVFVQTGAGLVRIDKEKGTRVWTSLDEDGGMMGGAFSSPVFATLHGTPQLLVQTRSELCGVDPIDGTKQWGVPVKTFRGMNILTPLAFGDAVFTSAYGGRAHLFDIKQERDTPQGDTAVDTETSATHCVVEERWNGRAQGYMTSPVQIDGYAYLYLRSKRFSCIELTTGKTMWTSEPIGDEYASLVACGKDILALMNTGQLLLIAASPERYDVKDQMQVAEAETWGHLAVDGDLLVIRELEALSCFTWK